MLKKTIKYTDYDGVEREEDFYFNLNKAEILEMEMTQAGGLQAFIQKIISTKDAKEIVKLFKDLVLKSYGEKSPDGRRFIKSEAISEAFAQTEAYPILFMSLATDADAAAEFVNGIVPKDLESDIKKIAEKNIKAVN